ncbi:MAG TPA: ImmA/IrrE family metallo-endopeptidase [Gemmataceae bacterium]|nr:ImmA/IrrE family metallo-endopeptidase [Gemmataceae bacterium]
MQRADLAQEALDKSLEVREEAGVQFGTPVNVFDLCELLDPKVRVRFADYSMEGCYIRSERPLIEVSTLRPLGRRVFNAAHELGHHVLGHPGSHLDEQLEEGRADSSSDPDEYAANTFAGFLLMPKIGIRRAFVSRGWSLASPRPEQAFVVACHFGVGYLTLVNHLAYGLRAIGKTLGDALRKVRLPTIRQALLGSNGAERLWVADQLYQMPTLDTEVGTTLLLPRGSQPEFDNLTLVNEIRSGRVFTASRPGITRVEAGGGWAVTVRVAKYQYSGWATNRHLEPEEGDEDE